MKKYFTVTVLEVLLVGLVVVVSGYSLGKLVGQQALAADCDKLGGFYVSSVVYECKRTND